MAFGLLGRWWNRGPQIGWSRKPSKQGEKVAIRMTRNRNWTPTRPPGLKLAASKQAEMGHENGKRFVERQIWGSSEHLSKRAVAHREIGVGD